jgi:hypothetical protein
LNGAEFTELSDHFLVYADLDLDLDRPSATGGIARPGGC